MTKKKFAGPLAGKSLRRWGATTALMLAFAGAASAYAQEPSASQATLNFVGADIESVVKAIGHYTKTTFIIDPRVKGTINLVSEKPVTKSEAFDMLASALRLQGYAVVRTDGYAKVVPEADAKLQAGPTIAGGVRGDQIATQIFRLNYENANNLVQVLRPLITPNNTINVNPGNNSVVITDYADNLKRLSKIIASLDAPATAELDVIPIQHAVASDVATLVNRLVDQAAPGAAASPEGKVTVLADPRTNSVLLRAPSAARGNLAKSLIAKLDQPTAQAGNVHVVYLKNADAVRLAQTLRAIVASEVTAQGAQTTAAQPQQQPQQQQQQGQQQAGLSAGAPLPQAQTPAALPTGGAGGYIQADPATNTLIITASELVYRNLRAVIDQLDSRRAQVYVESLIVEMTATNAAEWGVQWLGLSGDSSSAYRVGGGTAFSTGGNNIINLAQAANAVASGAASTAAVVPGNGLTLGIFRQTAGKLGLGAIAHLLESGSKANILSMPNLVTLDNEEARIIVGQNVPFITGQYTTSASGASNPFQTIERRDIGLALRVRPQISEGGTIKLQIYQETSNIQDQSNPAGIITSKRSFESNILVDDGQVIVLGGLIENSLTDTEEKVPGLGDIPVLGNLFKYKSRSRSKTNLMVFLRPTVMRSSEQSANVVADRYDYIRSVQAAQQPEQSYILPNEENPQLAPLIGGRPVGGASLQYDPRSDPGAVMLPPATTPMPSPTPAPGQNPQNPGKQ